ncbi:MAG: 4Fe-4S binding protein [Anaerolineaceae bacterium]|nr:4Fe-4S binding protein [Anaerolineaceae bacterium]
MASLTGLGMLKGLWVTFRHLVDTYLVDLRWGGKRYRSPEGLQDRMSYKTRGIFTVQYPEEKLPVPENFRFIPFLVHDEMEDGEIKLRCTACGMCVRVCPPQCIWITRAVDPQTNKPVNQPAEFVIEADVCMNCGLCAEFCPFDAIQMDHDYEIAVRERQQSLRYDLKKLSRPANYHAAIHPLRDRQETLERTGKKEEGAA